MAEDDEDDGIRGPETCYFCGLKRGDYFGMLCDECRAKAKELEVSIKRARGDCDV